MDSENKIVELEEKYRKLNDDFEILQDSIHRLSSIALICFLLGLIAGFLI